MKMIEYIRRVIGEAGGLERMTLGLDPVERVRLMGCMRGVYLHEKVDDDRLAVLVPYRDSGGDVRFFATLRQDLRYRYRPMPEPEDEDPLERLERAVMLLKRQKELRAMFPRSRGTLASLLGAEVAGAGDIGAEELARAFLACFSGIRDEKAESLDRTVKDAVKLERALATAQEELRAASMSCDPAAVDAVLELLTDTGSKVPLVIRSAFEASHVELIGTIMGRYLGKMLVLDQQALLTGEWRYLMEAHHPVDLVCILGLRSEDLDDEGQESMAELVCEKEAWVMVMTEPSDRLTFYAVTEERFAGAHEIRIDKAERPE